LPFDGTGAIIGFDFQVNDDQGSGKRDSISKWNDPTNDSWQSTAGFGVLIFKKESISRLYQPGVSSDAKR
jgi:hypothetical protein